MSSSERKYYNVIGAKSVLIARQARVKWEETSVKNFSLSLSLHFFHFIFIWQIKTWAGYFRQKTQQDHVKYRVGSSFISDLRFRVLRLSFRKSSFTLLTSFTPPWTVANRLI